MMTITSKNKLTTCKSWKYSPPVTQFPKLSNIRIFDIHCCVDSSLSSSSSHNMSSSASQHNPSTKCSSLDTETTSSDADSPNTSKTSSQINGHQRATIPLTEAALKQHEFRYHPMATIDRIEYWNISGDFDEFVDDFDDTTYYSKPVRSERVGSKANMNCVLLHYM